MKNNNKQTNKKTNLASVIQEVLADLRVMSSLLGLNRRIVFISIQIAHDYTLEANDQCQREPNQKANARENKALCYAELIAQITAGEWANEAAETSKQIDYARCVAKSFQADQFAQIHCRRRIHAGHSDCKQY